MDARTTEDTIFDADQLLAQQEEKKPEQRGLNDLSLSLPDNIRVAATSFIFLSTDLCVAGYQDGNLCLINPNNGEALDNQNVGNSANIHALAKISSSKFISVHFSGLMINKAKVQTWEIQNNKIIPTISWDFSHSYTAKYLATVTASGKLIVCYYERFTPNTVIYSSNAENALTPIGYLPTTYSPITAMSAINETLVTGHDDGTIRLWNINAKDPFKAPIAVIPEPPAQKTTAQIKPAHWWSSKKAEAPSKPISDNELSNYLYYGFSNPKAIYSLAVSPDQKIIASSHVNDEVNYWNVSQKKRVNTFAPNGGEARNARSLHLDTSPDGFLALYYQKHSTSEFYKKDSQSRLFIQTDLYKDNIRFFDWHRVVDLTPQPNISQNSAQFFAPKPSLITTDAAKEDKHETQIKKRGPGGCVTQ